MTDTITAPVWADADHVHIDCLLERDGQQLPFTASASDSDEAGRALFARIVDGEFGTIADYAPPAPPPIQVPQTVSPRQLKLALLAAGLLDKIDAFVAASSTPRAVQISWEYATEYRRDNALLNQMAQQLDPPMSAAQIDQLFTAAAAIE